MSQIQAIWMEPYRPKPLALTDCSRAAAVVCKHVGNDDGDISLPRLACCCHHMLLLIPQETGPNNLLALTSTTPCSYAFHITRLTRHHTIQLATMCAGKASAQTSHSHAQLTRNWSTASYQKHRSPKDFNDAPKHSVLAVHTG